MSRETRLSQLSRFEVIPHVVQGQLTDRLALRKIDLAQLIFLRSFYTDYYQSQVADSTNFQRKHMISSLKKAMNNSGQGERVLDIGSGRQLMEAEYLTYMGGLQTTLPVDFHTIDIFQLDSFVLCAEEHPQIQHYCSDACALTFSDACFNLIISNMAIDLLPPEALSEAYRVLIPGGRAFFNLHYNAPVFGDGDIMIPENYFWYYLRQYYNRPYLNKKNIRKDVELAGFQADRIILADYGSTGSFWKVDLTKPVV